MRNDEEENVTGEEAVCMLAAVEEDAIGAQVIAGSSGSQTPMANGSSNGYHPTTEMVIV